MPQWKLQPRAAGDKELLIVGPEVTVLIDFDDVHHHNVKAIALRLVKTLNTHFEKDHGKMEFSERTGNVKFVK